ncbi:unnamed protein product, partial [Discosporangium mesarthrocarpum]
LTPAFPPPARPPRLKKVASWTGNLLVSLFFLRLLSVIGPVLTFLLFAVVSTLGLAFLCCFLPETKGKEPQQITQDIAMR